MYGKNLETSTLQKNRPIAKQIGALLQYLCTSFFTSLVNKMKVMEDTRFIKLVKRLSLSGLATVSTPAI